MRIEQSEIKSILHRDGYTIVKFTDGDVLYSDGLRLNFGLFNFEGGDDYC